MLICHVCEGKKLLKTLQEVIVCPSCQGTGQVVKKNENNESDNKNKELLLEIV
jgi:DnaJ-class molecular chaperone